MPADYEKKYADYVPRRFNPESIRGWDTALRDLQIQLEPRVSRSEAIRSLAENGSWFRAEVDCS